MEAFIIALSFCLLILGFIGCIVPAVPGPPIAFISLLLIHQFTDNNFTTDTLWMLAGIVTIITFLDYWLQIYGVKKFGGGKKAINGTIIGLVLGLLVLPLGIIIGPFLGAYIGAKMEEKDNNKVLKIAFGALAGFLGGTLLKIGVTVFIGILLLNQFFSFW